MKTAMAGLVGAVLLLGCSADLKFDPGVGRVGAAAKGGKGNGQGGAGTQTTLDTLTLSCAGSGETWTSVRVCAGASGAPAGFTLQWMTSSDYGAVGWAAAASSCEASLSGNASGAAFVLAPFQCMDVSLGDLPTAPGVSGGCGPLACGESYVVRAFAHAGDGAQRSAFSDTLAACSTSACPGFRDGEYCSFSQGGYHNSGTAGTLLANAWSSVFPSGLTLSSDGPYSMFFHAAANVAAYLPANGTAGQLDSVYVDPLVTSSGVLGGQVLTLELNVDLSAAGVLPATQENLGSLRLCNVAGTEWAALEGMTIGGVLDGAKAYLTGGTVPAQFAGLSAASINQLVESLAVAFDQAYVDGAGVTQPCGAPSEFAQTYLCRSGNVQR